MGGRLPEVLRPWRNKLYALTIRPERLARIRTARRPDSRYASLRQCQYEVARARGLTDHEKLPTADTTALSIEELAATIIQELDLARRLY